MLLRVKMQATEQVKTFVIHINDKGLEHKIPKILYKLI